MIFEIIITSALFALGVGLSFLSIDIIAISSIFAALRFGMFYGIFLSFSKLIAGLIRKKIDHRTMIHLLGIIMVISIGSLFQITYFWYPLVLFLAYILLTFPIIQYIGGDVFKGMLYNVKDMVTAIIFLWLTKTI